MKYIWPTGSVPMVIEILAVAETTQKRDNTYSPPTIFALWQYVPMMPFVSSVMSLGGLIDPR